MKRGLTLFITLVFTLTLVGCSGEKSIPENSVSHSTENIWGITLSLENLSLTGATIVCTQSGGSLTGRLETGSYYVVEQLGPDNDWKPLREGEIAWTMEAYLVTMGGITKWDVDWEWLYGQLPDGHYRIGKQFMDFRGAGDYDSMMIYTEFEIN